MLQRSNTPQGSIALRNAILAHPETAMSERADVLIVDGVIAEVAPALSRIPEDAAQFNLNGRFVFPGLVDAHVHVTAVRHNLRESAALPPSYVFGGAATILRGMLKRGFTTVRDVGGADWGLAEAANDGTLGAVPRLVFCGHALSQTGGHGDMRARGDYRSPCCSIGIVCDGVDEVRHTVRAQAARGAGHIKLMLGGGVASEFDRLEADQFSDDEVSTAVAEAASAGLYVTAHAYTAHAVARAIRLGIRCIEHGNLLDDEVAKLMAETKTFYVPTLISYEELANLVERGEAPSYVAKKLESVREEGLRALESAARAGVTTVFGSDLLGAGHPRQLSEFAIRSAVQSPAELFFSATTAAARLLGLDGQIGTLAVGSSADVVVSSLNPLERSLAHLAEAPFAVIARGRVDRRLNDLILN